MENILTYISTGIKNLYENYFQVHLKCNIPLKRKHTESSNTLKQFVPKLPTNCLSVFDHFEGLALKGLNYLNYDLQQIAKSLSTWSLF